MFAMYKFLLLFLGIFSCVFAQEKKICVAVMIKNHADIIWKSLYSAAEIADCFCIYNAGSQDGTEALVKQFFKERRLPEIVHTNMSNQPELNKSFVLKTAKETLTKEKFSLADSYILLLDPYLKVKITPAFDKNLLHAESYLVLEKSANVNRYNAR